MTSRWIRAALIGLVLFVSTEEALTESSGEAIKTFGLIGAWSPDCLQDPMKGGSRITFAVSVLGSPSADITSSSFIKDVWIIRTHRWDIQSAVRVTEEKIRLTFGVIYSDTSVTPAPKIHLKDQSAVIQKDGNKIRFIDQQTLDGSQIMMKDGYVFDFRSNNTGRPVVPDERCLN